MIRLPDYIQDDAILTRLWGYSDQPEVTVNGRPVPVTDGTWESAFEDGDMLLADADSRVTLHNVRHGLVILAAGQSNMEWPVRDSLNEDEICRRLEGKDISWLQVPRILYPGHDSGEDMQWHRLKPDAIGDVSAVGLLATLEVAERTGRPIGLVGCYKGGSSAASWVPEEDLKADPALEAFYVTDYWADIADQTDEEEDARIAAFEQEVDNYNRRFADFDKAHPELSRAEKKDIMGHTPFPGPKGRKDFLRPAGLWDTMATRLKGLAPDILLWYQGEEDTKFAKGYKSLLTKLLARWRRELEQPDLPVVIAQLPGYMEYNPDKDWGTLRLAQMAVAESDSDARRSCACWMPGTTKTFTPKTKPFQDTAWAAWRLPCWDWSLTRMDRRSSGRHRTGYGLTRSWRPGAIRWPGPAAMGWNVIPLSASGLPRAFRRFPSRPATGS